MTMRILVTNDDGVSAEGLQVAEAIARELAGPQGEIWTIAPAFQQSGVAHAITYNSPIQVEKLAERRFAVAGAPADCVIVGVHHLMDEKPDLVLSGVNRGRNLAEDALYSGTLGAAMEGALQGCKALGLSQFFARGADGAPAFEDMFQAAKAYGVEAAKTALNVPWTPDLFFNINFPAVRAEHVKGLRFAAQGRRRNAPFGALERTTPSRTPYYWITHDVSAAVSAPEGDDALCQEGWTTIVPMRPDLTDRALLAQLETEGAAGAQGA